MAQEESTGRERRYARTKQGILDTALTLISERGVEELSLREVARRADFSPAALYRYFESKEELIAALAADALQRMAAHLSSVQPDLDPRERLIRLGLAYLAFARENSARFQLLFSDLPSRRRSLTEPVPDTSPYAALLCAVREAIKTGHAAPLAPDGDDAAESLAYALWSLVHGMASLQQVHLRTFDASFEAVYRLALERMLGTKEDA